MRMTVLFFLSLFILTACSSQSTDYLSPRGYDLNSPIIYKLPLDLVEISGHAFYRGNSDTVYAEQDEVGAVYAIVLGGKYKREATFRNHGDFEDMAFAGDQIIIMRSDGKLFVFPKSATYQKKISGYRTFQDLVPKDEYEGLYVDSTQNKLYMLCKNCKVDKKKNQSTGYIFDLDPTGNLINKSTFTIDTKPLAQFFKRSKINFRPSAMARNFNTDEWYILSSVNRCLVVTDLDWKIKEIYSLDPWIYIQPEGLAFDNKNDLYISSEGTHTRTGRIMKIKYNPSSN